MKSFKVTNVRRLISKQEKFECLISMEKVYCLETNKSRAKSKKMTLIAILDMWSSPSRCNFLTPPIRSEQTRRRSTRRHSLYLK